MHPGKQKKPVSTSKYIVGIMLMAVLFSCFFVGCLSRPDNKTSKSTSNTLVKPITWKAPDTATIPAGKVGELIRYGRELIAHTAQYLGPKGSVAQISNGMNCQNCHLDAGNRLFGNDYAGFIASYPKMSARLGRVEPASERITECFERSLAGTAPGITTTEMQAMLAYMTWIGKDVKKGQKVFGSATQRLAFMKTPADAAKGKNVFVAKCTGCHGSNGEGMLAADKASYTNPPLWGPHSYNDGAGMYRVINLAGFVKRDFFM